MMIMAVDESNTKLTLEWLKGLCENALTESRNGNVMPAALLRESPLTAYFFTNVHCLRTISPEQFARDYPAEFTIIDEQRRSQEQTAQAKHLSETVAQQAEQIAAMQQALDALKAALAALDQAEGDTPAADTTAEEDAATTEDVEPKKPKAKPKK